MRLVIAACAAALLAAQPTAAQNAPLELRPGETLLEVEAEGVESSRPDVMTISAGAVTTGATVRQASQANAALMDRLVEAIRAQGIAPEDLRTTELGIMARFDRTDRERADEEDREPRIVGYVATNRLEVKLRDLGRATALLDALLEAGANSVSGPIFSHSDPRPARRTARANAVSEARAEAEEYARALGMRIARVLRVSERGREIGSDHSIIVTGSRIRAANLEPGQIETRIRVWVDYALAPQ